MLPAVAEERAVTRGVDEPIGRSHPPQDTRRARMAASAGPDSVAIWAAARAAHAGCAEALARLATLVRPQLMQVARARLRNAADAEDAVQDALLGLPCAIRTYDPDQPPLPLLRTLAHRRAVDILRRRTRSAAAEAEHAAPRSIHPVAEDSALLGELRLLIAGLPRAQREALELTRIQGLSLQAAAAACGRTPGALKVAAHRGTQRLRAVVAVP